MTYVAAGDRYSKIPYRRCGRSGIMLPEVSLGLWQNFGDDKPMEVQRAILRRAFDLGVTHFDLANNYGPPYGSAEINFGRLYAEDFRPFRDELVISTKAGYDMWSGPYGSRGSRNGSLAADSISEDTLGHVRALNEIAAGRGQSLAQLAIAWTLRDERVTSALIGASSVQQLEDNLAAAQNLSFTADELSAI